VRIAEGIEQRGSSVWAFSREDDTVLGENWYIEHELPMLAACQVVVFVVSRRFASSYPCQDELRKVVNPARRPRRRFFAVVIDDIDLCDDKPMSADVDDSPAQMWGLLQENGSKLLGRAPTADEIEAIARAAKRLVRPTGEADVQPHGIENEPPDQGRIRLPVTERWASSGSSVLVVVDAHAPGAASARRWLHREHPDRVYGADSWRFGRALYLGEVKPALERLSGAAD